MIFFIMKSALFLRLNKNILLKVKRKEFLSWKKIDTVTIIYYLFILVAIILLIKSLFFNDNNHGLLVGITIIGIAVLRKIK